VVIYKDRVAVHSNEGVVSDQTIRDGLWKEILPSLNRI